MKQFRIVREYVIPAESEELAQQKLDEPASHIRYLRRQRIFEIRKPAQPRPGNAWIAAAIRQILGR